MYEACRVLNSKLLKIGVIVKDIKGRSKEKWISKYQNLARKIHDEDYEQANREERFYL
jgi:hypothetical protein